MFSRLQNSMQGEFGVADLDQLPQLGEMITGIEKVKYFNYDGWKSNEDQSLIAQLESEVLEEGYESLMTARMDGNHLNIMIKERRGEPEGFVVIVRMEDGFSIIDIEGYPDVNKILELSQFINSSEEMGLTEIIGR